MNRYVCLDKDFIKVDVIVFKLIVSACVPDRLVFFFGKIRRRVDWLESFVQA